MDRHHLEQLAALKNLRDDHSVASIDDVVSGVFPAYSSRESVNSDPSSICQHEPIVDPEQGVNPCYNFARGVLFVIKFDQNGDVDYTPVELTDLNDESPGRFHCFDCGLHFENKISLQIHLLKSGFDLNDEKSCHIVCPVCFIEFMPPDRVDRMAEHVRAEHDWEYQFVMHGMGFPGPQTGFDDKWRQYVEFSIESKGSSDAKDEESKESEESEGNTGTGIWFLSSAMELNKRK